MDNKISILIVEDEAIVAADLAGKLQQIGYAVAGIAAGGETAVALADRLRPDLVLMDIRLEGAMDGIAAAEEIRRRNDLPVIYLTAHSDAATLNRAKVSGPSGYVLKPFEERDLATQIELALYKHQADREIRAQREWLRVTLTSIGDAVIATDAEGRVNFLNPVAAALTGWREEEAAGLALPSIFKIINELTGEPLEEPISYVLREGRTVTLANHAALVTKDGRTVPIEDSAAPILDAAGQVIGAVLVFHDRTEKRRAAEELEKLASFPEENPNPVLRIARDHRLLYANAASRTWLAAGWDWRDRTRLPEPFQVVLTKALATERPVEEEIVSQTGRTFWLTAANPPGKAYVTIYGRDITDQKRAEKEIRDQVERLLALNKELDRFNRVAVDRELRMLELKKEINALCDQAGRPARYKVDFE